MRASPYRFQKLNLSTRIWTFFYSVLFMCEATSESLYDGFQQVRARLDLRETDFHRGNQPLHARRLYAPTEDCKWRGKVLHGEVHDENTWALCGVAPHAGLFGPIDDLSHWGLALRDAYYGKGPLKKTSCLSGNCSSLCKARPHALAW